MCLSLSLTFFCLLLSLYLGLQKPNGMWVNLCAVLLNIFVIFFSCVFVIVVAFVLYLLSWPQEPTGVWVSVLIGDQAVFHKEIFTDSYVCVYIYRYRYICVCQCEHYIFMFVLVLVFVCVFVLDFIFAFFSLYIYTYIFLYIRLGGLRNQLACEWVSGLIGDQAVWTEAVNLLPESLRV